MFGLRCSVFVLLVFAAPASAADPAELLSRNVPEYRYHSGEPHPAISVEDFDAGRERSARAPAYGRAVRDGSSWFLQYWTLHADNPQDRGIVRTGRHRGDWELVQLRLDAGGAPLDAVYAQHAWAERCGLRGRPVVFVAHGSHAAYFSPGVHDRPWPDPDDEADGRGSRLRPRVEPISDGSPAWMRRPRRWGGSEAGWVPGEQSSPRGPAFQPDRWDDPAAFHASARPCGSGAPGRWWQAPLMAGLVALPALILWRRRAARRL